jgi:hypothetical protein
MATVSTQIINGFRPMHLTALVMAMVSAFLIVTVLSITPVGALNIDPSAAPDPTATPPTSNGITPTPPAAAAPSAAAPSAAAASDEEDEIVCVGGPLGYITCPLIQLTTLMVRGIANFLDNLFNFQALGDSALREAWGAFVNLANIILAVGFLVVIMSQASSIGISSYGIKRILPRIVAGAILINMSFYVCALAVDFSNVLGHNMMSFTASLTAGTVDSGDSTGNVDVGGVQAPSDCGGGLTEKVLGETTACLLDIIGAGMSGGFLIATIFIFIMLIATFIAFATTLALVIMRYVILIFLILLAPLAFAAWVLPNTEQYFKKWWTLFIKLLVIYPAAMFLFGGSIFVAKLLGGLDIKEMFGDANIPDVVAQAMWAAFQLFIIAMPLFFIPKLFKGLDGVTGGLSAKLAKAGSAGAMYKLGKTGAAMGGKRAAPYAKFGMAATVDALASNQGRVGKITTGIRNRSQRTRARKLSIDQSLAARKAGREAELSEMATERGAQSPSLRSVGGSRYDSFIQSQAAEADMKKVKDMISSLNNTGAADSITAMKKSFDTAVANGDTITARATHNILKNSGSQGKDALAQSLQALDGKVISREMGTALNTATKDAYGDLMNGRADAAKSFANHIDGDDAHSKFTMGNISGLTAEQLSKQQATTIHSAIQQNVKIDQRLANEVVTNDNLTTTGSQADWLLKALAERDATALNYAAHTPNTGAIPKLAKPPTPPTPPTP